MMAFQVPLREAKNWIKQSKYGTALLLLSLLISILILAFIVPIVLYNSPAGTDAFTHLYNTLKMAQSNSLVEYYQRSFISENLGYDYPFGMWYFGSICMKITGLDAFDFVVSFTVIIILMSLVLYYIYAQNLLKSINLSILSLVFLITTPLLVLNLPIYSTREFMMIFSILIMHLALKDFNIKNAVILAFLVFILIFSHTGTFLFLFTFTITFFLIYCLLWEKMHTSMYYLAVISLFLYVVTVRIFPFVQPQYIDKGRLILTVADWLSKISLQDWFREMGSILYANIFVSNNITYALFWSCLLFVAGKTILFAHKKIKVSRITFHAIPFLSDIQNVSHGIALTPFWMGPIQTILSIPGFFRLDSKGKCLAISLVISTVLPSGLSAGETGAIREIYYMYLIIPVTAALGFMYILDLPTKYPSRLSKRLSIISRISGIFKNRWVATLFFGIILVPLIITSIIGNLHYQPDISGTTNEKENLLWLSTIGDSTEGVPGYYYRDRIFFYANKTSPSISRGSETTRFNNALNKTLFSFGSEQFTRELYDFNIKYIIFSDKIAGNFRQPTNASRVDSNQVLDKIYASDKRYGIFRYIREPERTVGIGNTSQNIIFTENSPPIKDLDPWYIIENNYYKMKLKRSSPQIEFLGTRYENFLGEGFFYDYITLRAKGDIEQSQYNLADLKYISITRTNNTLVYRTYLTDSRSLERVATLTVTYSFYERCVKREILIANDWLDTGSSLGVLQTSNIFGPYSKFSYHQLREYDEILEDKRIYPSEDIINIKDKLYDDIHLEKGDSGVYIRYGDVIPYPTDISYRGSTLYEYSQVNLPYSISLAPSQPARIVQYFSIGDRLTASANIDHYNVVSPFPFPGSKNPLVIMGFTDIYALNTTRGNADQLLRDKNIPYHEIIPPGASGPGNTGTRPVIFYTLYEGRALKSQNTINSELQEFFNQYGTRGLFFAYFNYHLGSVKALSDNQFLFMPAYTVPSPIREFFREGWRNPAMAYYHGEETGVMLLPISLPYSSAIDSLTDAADVFERWEKALESVSDKGGMAVFLWDPKDIGVPDLIDRYSALLDLSASQGLGNPSLEDIALYTRLVQNITARVKRGTDSVDIQFRNWNPEGIHDATYVVRLPVLNKECPYLVENGTIRRVRVEYDTCILFTSLSLEALNEREVKIMPNITRKQFSRQIPVLYEGSNTITVRDADGNPVQSASVIVDDKRVTTDDKGEASFSTDRGMHQVVLEKAGFVPKVYTVESKPRILQYTSYFRRE